MLIFRRTRFVLALALVNAAVGATLVLLYGWYTKGFSAHGLETLSLWGGLGGAVFGACVPTAISLGMVRAFRRASRWWPIWVSLGPFITSLLVPLVIWQFPDVLLFWALASVGAASADVAALACVRAVSRSKGLPRSP